MPPTQTAGAAPAPSSTPSPAAPREVLIAGGQDDPNIASIAWRAQERGLPARVLLVGREHNPSLVWDVQADRLLLDGEEIRPGAAFIRYDVFAGMADRRKAVSFRAQAWFTAIQGWMLSHADVRVANRGYAGQTNKPFMLRLAAECGLPIPRTLVTNDLAMLDDAPDAVERVAKPVAGGGYCQALPDLLRGSERRDGRAAAPAIVQERLVAPEVRVYGIGGRYIPFEMRSPSLDYRVSQDAEVLPMRLEDVDPALVQGLGRLMERLGMEYGAADFKTNPATGGLTFLEINSGPMFAAFDRAGDYSVSDARLDWLTA
ncbi:MAG TPA: hypothetical protein VFQ45_18440 [Longimicrobium sp.]|nr:hypothetical protein [Longimicrobium sp.]